MQLDLFEYAGARAPAAAAPPQAAWDDAGATLWGRAWLANARRLCTPKVVSELAFGEKLLAAGRLTSSRVRRAHVQATFTNREGGTALVNLQVKPLPPARWLQLDPLLQRCGAALFDADELPDEALASLFGAPDGLLPERADLAFSCSHCRTPFCLYRAAALLAVAAELDRAPIRLFELRGAPRELLALLGAQQAAEADERLDEAALPALFGIEWA